MFSRLCYHDLIGSNDATGTIRSNLDPFSQHDDARLWDALRRSYLIETADAKPSNGGEVANKTRFTLDTTVEAEGANLSVGERSLLSLARALVKDSKVVGMYSKFLSVTQKAHSHSQCWTRLRTQTLRLICKIKN